jgi:ATP-dependent RNA helicase DeaD
LETKLGITMERQNLAGKTLAKTVKTHSFKPHKKAPKRGKTAVGKNKRGTKYAEASRKQKDRDGNVKDRRQEGKLSLGRGKRRRTSR